MENEKKDDHKVNCNNFIQDANKNDNQEILSKSENKNQCIDSKRWVKDRLDNMINEDPLILQSLKKNYERKNQMRCFSNRSCELSNNINKSRNYSLNNYVLSSPSQLLSDRLKQNVNNYNNLQNINVLKSKDMETDNLFDIIENNEIEVNAIVDNKVETDVWNMLRIEPKDDNERKEKFNAQLKQSQQLDNSLSLLLKTWDDNKNLFEDKPRENIERDIKNLHKHDNQICPDPKEGEWICQYMAKKLDENSKNIENLCESIPKKLEYMNKLDPCCICLDTFEDIKNMEILECFHKVCKECWKHWVTVQQQQNRNAFCPLCRRDQFNNDIFDYCNMININM